MPLSLETLLRQGPLLALVTNRQRTAGSDLVSAVAQAVSGGVGMVLLREKELPAAELLALALRLREITRGRALFLVNDRVDVALACGADGVHLGEAGLPTAVARQLAAGRERFLIGRSVHSLAAAARYAEAGADYLTAGNIYETASHPGRPAAGTDFLQAITTRVAQPALAIGGITAANAPKCVRAGAAGIAVIGAILGAPAPETAARKLRAVLDKAGKEKNDHAYRQW